MDDVEFLTKMFFEKEKENLKLKEELKVVQKHSKKNIPKPHKTLQNEEIDGGVNYESNSNLTKKPRFSSVNLSQRDNNNNLMVFSVLIGRKIIHLMKILK